VRPDGSDLQRLTSGDWSHVQPAWSAESTELSAFRFQEFETAEYGGVVIIPVRVQ